MENEPIHSRHYLDGYPLCWPIDAESEEEFVTPTTLEDSEVTCPDCIRHMEEWWRYL